MADERALAERLITYDTSRAAELRSAAGFVKGWLEARDVRVHDARTFGDLPVITGEVGPGAGGPLDRSFHGHLDVVPGRAEQFEPRVEGDRLIGRGAYDMKGGLAAMLCALHDLAEPTAAPRALVCVPDEESEEVDEPLDRRARGPARLRGDFAITGEPTDLHIGVQAKGVLAMRVEVAGRAAHGSTPWLGDNAVLKAIDVFRRIESMPFARESSELFDRPRSTSGGSTAATRSTRCPTAARWPSTSATCPARTRVRSSRRCARCPTSRSRARSSARRRSSRARTPTCARCATPSRARRGGEAMSVGRDGASDAISFLEAGIPAVEFGPRGGGHHGPEEWVSIASLRDYRAGARATSSAACRPGSSATSDRTAGRPAGHRGRPGVSARRPPAAPPRASGAGWRAALRAGRGARGRAARRRRRRPPAILLEVDDGRQLVVNEGAGDQDRAEVTEAAAGGPQTILHDRLRPALQGPQGRPQRPLGHDHPRAAEPERERDDACCRSRATSRSTCAPASAPDKINAAYSIGGPRADGQGRQAPALDARSPSRSTTSSTSTSLGFTRGRQPPRLRLRRHRPPLLQRQQPAGGRRRPRLRDDRHPARLPAAVRARTRSDYVRFRHLDTDIVRAARQQDFLRQAKQQYGASQLLGDRRKLGEDLRHATRRPTRRCTPPPGS